MARSGRSRRLGLAYLILAAVALGNAGCLVAAAAGAAGGVGAYAYYKGKVSRTYVANVEDVRAATHKALAELQMPILKEEPGTRGGTIASHSGDDGVTIAFELQDSHGPGEGPMTQVGVRVGTFGSGGLSERILDQIAFHLVPVNALPPGPPPLVPVPQATPGPVQQTAAPPLAK